jgi:hypothetical protein
VELLARRAHGVLAERTGWEEWRIRDAMAPYWSEYDTIGIDGDARSASFFRLVESPGRWEVQQTLADPAGDGEWRLTASIDLAAAIAEGAPTLRLEQLGPDASTDQP